MKSRPRLFRVISLGIIALFLAAAAADCGNAVKSAISAVVKGSDDTSRVVIHAADPTDLKTAANGLDDLVAKVPNKGSLSPAETAAVTNAESQAAALREFAVLLGAADEVAALITKDSVLLVKGSFIFGQNPTPQFAAYMDNVAEALLKDTTCSSFATLMSAQQSQAVAQYAPSFTRVQPSEPGVRQALVARLTSVGYQLDDVQSVLDTVGISSKIVTTAKGYVGKTSSAVTATTWNNSGATNAYLRLCIFR